MVEVEQLKIDNGLTTRQEAVARLQDVGPQEAQEIVRKVDEDIGAPADIDSVVGLEDGGEETEAG